MIFKILLDWDPFEINKLNMFEHKKPKKVRDTVVVTPFFPLLENMIYFKVI